MRRIARSRSGRRRAGALGVGLGFLALLGAGCGARPPEDGPAPTPAPTADPTSAADQSRTARPSRTTEPQPPDVPAPEALTEADDGRRITLARGDELPLRLSDDWTWAQPRVEGDAVALAPVDHFADPGFVEWLVLAERPGQAVVEVDGEPACGDPSACPAMTVRLTFEVQG